MPDATQAPRSDDADRTPRHPALDWDDDPTPDVETLLEVLSDEYARAVLEALREEARPARDLVDSLEMSRATVYRRLDSLEEAGLVESTMSVRTDGNHRKRFQATLDRVELSFEGGDLVVDRLT